MNSYFQSLIRRCFMAILFAAILMAAACDRRGMGLSDLPTVASVDGLATQTVLTENAPPPGFRDSVTFSRVDAGLNEVSGWHYDALLDFDGTFARTSRKATASTHVQMWFNQVGSAQRAVIDTASNLLGRDEKTLIESVRLGPDVFLLKDNVCLNNAGEDAQKAADLNAGTLIGGVSHATPAAKHAVINSEEAWLYAFTADDLELPNIQPREGGRITLSGGELWIAPKYNAVVRFYVNLEVENAGVFGSQLPVTGTILLRYDLTDVGVVPNISVPFGC